MRLLDETHTFRIGAVEELLEGGSALMDAALEACEELRAAAADMKAAYASVPPEARHPALLDGIQELEARLRDSHEYTEMKHRLRECLERILGDVPRMDEEAASALREAGAGLERCTAMARTLLESVPDGMSGDYAAFSLRLARCRRNICDLSFSLEERLAALQDALKGVGAGSLTICGGDPVQLATGNLVCRHTDLSIRGAVPFSFERFYNSLDLRRGSLGEGWSHSHEAALEERSSEIILRFGDGREERFYRDGEVGTGSDGTDSDGADSLPVTYAPFTHAAGILVSGHGMWQYRSRKEGIFLFDAAGRCLSLAAPGGQTVRYSYGRDGRLAKAQDGTGAFFRFAYQEQGLLSSLRDHAGREVRFEYTDGLLAAVTGPEGSRHAYRYTGTQDGRNGREQAAGRLREILGPDGKSLLSCSYDGKGRVTSQTLPDGGMFRFRYREPDPDTGEGKTVLVHPDKSQSVYVHDSRFRHIRTLHADGREQTEEAAFVYDGHDRRIQDIIPGGSSPDGSCAGGDVPARHATCYSYREEDGQLAGRTGPLGHTVTLHYDSLGRLVRSEYPDGSASACAYDGSGRLSGETGRLGGKTSYGYDPKGRVCTVRRHGGDDEAASICYDERGNIASWHQAGHAPLAFRYDGLNRVVLSSHGESMIRTYAYDREDRLTQAGDGAGNACAFAYDSAGRLAGSTGFDGSTLAAAYTPGGQLAAFTDPEGHVSRWEYDLRQNIIKAVGPAGAEWAYSYDSRGRLSAASGPLGGTTHYSYDGAGNLSVLRTADGTVREYGYDAGGNRVTERQDGRLARVLSYDGEGRLVRQLSYTSETGPENLQDGTAVATAEEFTYNGEGQLLTHARDGILVRENRYDPFGRILSETCFLPSGEVQRTGYCYDSCGRLEQVMEPSGDGTVYRYDRQGRVAGQQYLSGASFSYAYDREDRVAAVTDQDGHTARYAYDCAGRLTEAADPLGRLTRYRYTASGRLAEVLDAGGGLTRYAYDPAGRLARVERTAAGKTETGPPETAAPEADTAEADTAQTDTAETAVAIAEDSGTENGLMRVTRFAYNPSGQLESVTDSDGAAESYAYDPAGRLARKTDREGTATAWHYDVGESVQAAYGDGSTAIFPAAGTAPYPYGGTALYPYDGIAPYPYDGIAPYPAGLAGPETGRPSAIRPVAGNPWDLNYLILTFVQPQRKY